VDECKPLPLSMDTIVLSVVSSLKRRKLNLKPGFESGSTHFSFKL
jgi:hypothetical protein